MIIALLFVLCMVVCMVGLGPLICAALLVGILVGWLKN